MAFGSSWICALFPSCATATHFRFAMFAGTDFLQSAATDASIPDSELVCQCPSPKKHEGVLGCANGTDILMNWQYWAGESDAEHDMYTVGQLRYITDLAV